MGDGRELTPAVVAALVRLARGAADGPEQAVAEVVRARLRATPEGARVVASVEASPGDPRGREILTVAVGQLLDSDRAFAHYLATTQLGRPADPPTVHLRTDVEPSILHLRVDPRSTDPGSEPATGPSTVQLRLDPQAAGAQAVATRRGNSGIVLALALLLVAVLVAVGVRLGSRPLLHPIGPELAHSARTLRDPAQVQAVLPDVRAMPGGWQVESGPVSGTGAGDDVPCLLPGACDQQLAYATVAFRAAQVHSVQFTVVSFISADAAGRAFGTMLDHVGGEDSAAAATIPPIGDQSAARTHGAAGAEALVRVGSTLLYVRDSGPGAPATTPVLTLFARLLAARAQQAQDGRTPDADAPADPA
ncbi:hypothetical protein [Kitasatospora sp. SUK 42]|uniref:hypothetical protein n=1 Tax=Kitasatospora sp. SUK 42 TaxID=1588882 RepID=UPI0018CB8B28|nr:hypothetical protein [Kitasatospora sp. SUK 42]MBV2155884.1 hypothetical protein [Kitasatospora sp. SUK 42]